MKFTYSISNNHYNRYIGKESSNVSALLKDLATKCVSPVTEYSDKEMQEASTGREWNSKAHRSNGTIESRGNIGMIDFEGKRTKLDELLSAMDAKSLFWVAIPSQSNRSDKRNARYHIIYLLSEPYSVNSESYKLQAQAFFNYIGYTWDEPDSGIDTRATFNACGYFAPTIQLKGDKGKGLKVIKDPYLTLDDVAKDTFRSKRNRAYIPEEPKSTERNEKFTSVSLRGRRVEDHPYRIVRTTPKGYVLSNDSYIETSSGRYMTFDQLEDALGEIEGENPRISGLGCPICNKGHTSDDTIGYAFMQYDHNGVPYVFCSGNACSHRPYFTKADGFISVYRVDDAAGVSKYVMFEGENLLYTHDRDLTFKLSPEAVADELRNRGMGLLKDGKYSRAATIDKYVVGVDSIQINYNPFVQEGLDIYERTYNISPAPRFAPIPQEPDEVIEQAVKAFEDDVYINGYPVSLIYLSYYMFHRTQIMAVLALVNPDRGSGKSFWVLDLPSWYLGYGKVGVMGSSAITAGWDDEKLGKRIVVYEDIEHLKGADIAKLKSNIKSDATAGDTKMLNIKGAGKKRSFGFNTAITTNAYDQIPFDGHGDRRIYPAPYKMLTASGWLASKLRDGAKDMETHRTNAINYLYKIYTECEESRDAKLTEALYYRVPDSKIRGIVEDSTSTDGYAATNIIGRSRTIRDMLDGLEELVVSDVEVEDLEDLLDEMDYSGDRVKIPGKTLHDLWRMLPTGRDSSRSLNQRSILRIFGIEGGIQTLWINGKSVKGVTVYNPKFRKRRGRR